MTNPLKASAEDQELIALFAGLDTPCVSDAMDKLGLHGQALRIMPLADLDLMGLTNWRGA
ncbi:hypothetical protein LMG24076_05383 [Trinickia soli]|nr:hypothetical protein LMG24076_05383 [Trinickia soli]